MTNPIHNCAVRAVAAITGAAHQDIVNGIAAFANEDGSAAFDEDGVSMRSVEMFLESIGWEVRYFENDPQIPWTCILSIRSPGHVLALIDGRVHDPVNLGYDGAEIDRVLVPPAGAARAVRTP